MDVQPSAAPVCADGLPLERRILTTMASGAQECRDFCLPQHQALSYQIQRPVILYVETFVSTHRGALEQAIPLAGCRDRERGVVMFQTQPVSKLPLVERAEQAAIARRRKGESGMESIQFPVHTCAGQMQVFADRSGLQQRLFVQSAQARCIARQHQHCAGSCVEHHHERPPAPEVDVGIPIAKRIFLRRRFLRLRWLLQPLEQLCGTAQNGHAIRTVLSLLRQRIGRFKHRRGSLARPASPAVPEIPASRGSRTRLESSPECLPARSKVRCRRQPASS